MSPERTLLTMAARGWWVAMAGRVLLWLSLVGRERAGAVVEEQRGGGGAGRASTRFLLCPTTAQRGHAEPVWLLPLSLLLAHAAPTPPATRTAHRLGAPRLVGLVRPPRPPRPHPRRPRRRQAAHKGTPTLAQARPRCGPLPPRASPLTLFLALTPTCPRRSLVHLAPHHPLPQPPRRTSHRSRLTDQLRDPHLALGPRPLGQAQARLGPRPLAPRRHRARRRPHRRPPRQPRERDHRRRAPSRRRMVRRGRATSLRRRRARAQAPLRRQPARRQGQRQARLGRHGQARL